MSERPDPGTMPFEAARTELDEIVGRLEDGGTTLEEALVLWERGEALHRRCAALLEGAEERLRVLRPVDPGD